LLRTEQSHAVCEVLCSDTLRLSAGNIISPVVLADGMLKADRVTGPGAAGFGG
jgi:hypothetical protein